MNKHNIKYIVLSIFVVSLILVSFLFSSKKEYASSTPFIQQYIINAYSQYRGTSKQVQLKEQSLTSVPSIFQYSIYNHTYSSSTGALCTYYPGPGPTYNTTPTYTDAGDGKDSNYNTSAPNYMKGPCDYYSSSK
jgi:type II secretory pathway pseudopilin PulG